ncbi:MAG: hypothetical protein VX831_04730 [Candidatus Thermoplasmatota archaeon]|nr:hypothetical protein [Candidatus Thermoplasmatota archaeon]
MDDEQSEEWPATDWDESASDDAPAEADGPDETTQALSDGTSTEDNDSASEVENDGADTPAAETDDAEAQGDSETATTPSGPSSASEAWTLPIRAAPILALQGEDVIEFPLSQHRSGLESTSLIMDDELMRIVEARYDPDGVRRLNVRMALVKKHISGYSHTHLDLFQKLQAVWWGAIGFGLVMATGFAQSILALGGGAFVLTGVAGLLMAQLDLHRLSFSDHGGRHDFYLSGWRQEPYLIHNSTALLGPAFVEFLRTSSLDTQHIDAVIKAMGAPAQPAPELTSSPEPAAPAALPVPVEQDTSLVPMSVVQPQTSVPSMVPAGPAISGPPTSTTVSTPTSATMPPLPPPPATTTPPSPQPLPAPPAPITLPAAPLPPPPAPAVLPPAPLPPAPLPPPPSQAAVDEDALWDDLS